MSLTERKKRGTLTQTQNKKRGVTLEKTKKKGKLKRI
jgi:hypothetical protein